MLPLSNQMCAFGTIALQIFMFNCRWLLISMQVSYTLSRGGGRGDNTQVGKIWSFLLFRLHDLEFQVIPLEEQFTDMNKVTVRIRHVFDCSSSL